MSIEFLLTTLIVVATPGTGVVYTLAAGLSRGARASIIAAVGCTLGIVPHMLAAITGLAAVLHTSAVAFQTLKYLGVAYLLYMAWSMLREKGALTRRGDRSRAAVGTPGDHPGCPDQHPQSEADDLLLRLPAAVRASGAPHGVLTMLELSAVFMVATFVVFAAYGVLAAASAQSRDLATACDDVAAAGLRRLVRGTGREAGVHVAITRRGPGTALLGCRGD